MAEEQSIEERREVRRIGHAVNALPTPVDFIHTLPISVRHYMYEDLVRLLSTYGDDNESAEELCIESICDGSGLHCAHMDTTHGANQLLTEMYAQHSSLRSVFTHPLHPEFRLFRDIDELFGGEREVVTVESRILSQISDMEHSLHRYGLPSDRRIGYNAARCMVVKYSLLLSVLYSVPLTEAAMISSSVSYPSLTLMAIHIWYGYFRDLLFGCALSVLAVLRRRMTSLYLRWHDYEGQYSVCPENGWLSYVPCGWYFAIRDYLECPTCTPDSLRALRLKQRVDPFNAYFDAMVNGHRTWIEVISLLVIFLLFVITCLSIRYAWGALCSWRTTVKVSSAIRDLKSPKSKKVSSVDETPNVVQIIEGVSKLIGTWKSRSPAPLQMLESTRPHSVVVDAHHDPTVVAILRYNSANKVFPVGMGFRYRDFLITVDHNLQELMQSSGTTILVPYVKGDPSTMSTDKRIELPTLVNIVPEDIAASTDLAVIRVGDNKFASIGVKSAQFASPLWGMTVTTTGPGEDNPNLSRAAGPVIKDLEQDKLRITYTASTLPGWSGAPVKYGNKVVALHQGSKPTGNYGLVSTFIAKVIDSVTSNSEESVMSSYSDYQFDENKQVIRGDDGYEADIERFDQRFDESDLAGMVLLRNTTTGKINFTTWKPKFGGPSWADMEDEGVELEHAPAAEFQGEFVDGKAPTASEQKPHHSKSTKLYREMLEMAKPLEESGIYRLERSEVSISAPTFKPDGRVQELFEPMSDRAATLGWVRGAMAMPDCTTIDKSRKLSTVSLLNNLKGAVDQHKNSKRWSQKTFDRAVKLTIKQLQSVKFRVPDELVTKQAIMKILNSSSIKDSNSPGLPFVTEGLQNNAAVISKYGVESLTDLIYSSYVSGEWINFDAINFTKGEPNKRSKINDGVTRTVQSGSLIVRVIEQCLQGALSDALIRNYANSPVQIGYSPLKEGAAQVFYDGFRKEADHEGKKMMTVDGKVADLYWHTPQMYSGVSTVIAELGVYKSTDPNLKNQFYNELQKAGRVSFLTSSGLRIVKTDSRSLISGSFGTINRNSLAGLIIDNCLKIEMGYSDTEILSFYVKVGGDDNSQVVDIDFNYKKYMAIALEHGIVLHKERVTPFSEGVEFYGNIYTHDEEGQVVFKPTRFGKHYESLCYTDYSNLADALLSHMTNWCHSEDHYAFFKDAYLALHDQDPENFDLTRIMTRATIIRRTRGQELGGQPINFDLCAALL